MQNTDPEEQIAKMEKIKKIKSKVREVLEDEEAMKLIQRIRCAEIEHLLEDDYENKELLEQYKKERLVALLKEVEIMPSK